jgi:type II secretory pathway pseudopilin PulG
MRIKNNKKKGFTLIELIFYIGLFSVFFVSLFLVLNIFYENKNKNSVTIEVEQQGLFISQIISQEIRNSQSIISPIIGNNSSSLSLQSFNVLRSPIIFYLDAGTVMLSEDGDIIDNLNSDRVIISDLNFINNSIIDDIQSINFSFTVSYKNNSGKKQYEYNKDFFGSVSLNLK